MLTKVILKDYGVYQGKNEFDFTCDCDKPIILVGGTNGAGKTTLFESIMLCFYGITALGKRITNKTYESFLAKKIHRYLGSSISADSASIIVEFKFYHDGKEIEYQVDRTWRNEDGKIIENLSVKKRQNVNDDFKSLDTIEDSHWQSFIEELIPKGIARLFFFDGEKIVQIAAEGNEDMAIKSSFSSLLGLDLIEQLRSDLQVNLMRNLTNNDKALQESYDKYSKEKEENSELIAHLREKKVRKQSELDDIRTEIESLEAKVTKIGGQFATKREEAKSRLAVKRLTLDNIGARIQELCAGVLPLSLIPKELEQLEDLIKKDEKIQQSRLEKEILDLKFKEIQAYLKDDTFWNEFSLPQEEKEKILTKVLSSISGKSTSDSKEKELFNLSFLQSTRIRDWIRESNSVVEILEKDTTKYLEVAEDVVKIETSIANAPNDDELGPLISKLNELHAIAGGIQTEIDHIETEISSNLALQKHITVKLRDIVSQRYKNKKSQVKAELTEKVQVVLDEYVEKLKIKKLLLLEKYLLDAIKILMHKKDFIERVSIDRDSFEVTLFRKNNDPFPKDLLSSGEKQMFATAILWALAKTSGRPLPFMIDTPLARLDEEHRINLVEKFFPLASHQVLIFSTDKEIELEHYTKLQPYMTRAFAMEYLPDNGLTKQHLGYFWNDKGEKIIAIH
ncbi:DNA sulfur modification protein DndD [Nitrosopumilus sp. b1]|uniref:DNA sulfur modification protein DndD n=1 Tax=Nitrosopumilus sp. b1 TaxID=2109907 RepID=UPI0015F39BFB|nr:DNA sulfur modification protein DndD [Nitrosopumilus sp. b1]